MPHRDQRGPHTERSCAVWGLWVLLTLPVVSGAPGPAQANELWHLSDEMESPDSSDGWTRVYQTENWLEDQLSLWDVSTSRPGYMSLEARVATWLDERRGPLIYKEVTGDFVITVQVEVTDTDGDGDVVPSGTFSSVGLMARQPSMLTSERFGPAREDYVFVALGTGDIPGAGFQWLTGEATNVVTTAQSTMATSGEALVQLARVGDAFILLGQSTGGSWQVLRRFSRPDLPVTLQVGIMVQADRVTALGETVTSHNHGLIEGGSPDLAAGLSYARFFRPTVPGTLSGLDLTNPGEVTEGQLIGFLADVAGAVPNENDLSTRVALVGDPVVPEEFGCNIAVVNEGGTSASNITLVFATDGPVQVQDIDGDGWTCTAATCTLASLAPGATSSLDAILRAAAGGGASCIATVFNESVDPAPSDNMREATFLVAPNTGGGTDDPPSDGGIDPPAEPPGDPKDYDQIDGQRVGGDTNPPSPGDSDQAPPPGCAAQPPTKLALLWFVLASFRGWRRWRPGSPRRQNGP